MTEELTVPQNDLELIDAVVAHRFGGDQERAHRALTHLGEALDRPGTPFYETVGNNCLVFFTNSEAMEICEQNPERYAGVIVDDFDVVLDSKSVVVGSFFRGPAAHRSGIIHSWRGPSRVFYSNVSWGELRNCSIVSSDVAGKLRDATITQSFIGVGILESAGLQATRSTVMAAHIGNVTLDRQVWTPAQPEPVDDTRDLASYMLSHQGIYLSPPDDRHD